VNLNVKGLVGADDVLFVACVPSLDAGKCAAVKKIKSDDNNLS